MGNLPENPLGLGGIVRREVYGDVRQDQACRNRDRLRETPWRWPAPREGRRGPGERRIGLAGCPSSRRAGSPGGHPRRRASSPCRPCPAQSTARPLHPFVQAVLQIGRGLRLDGGAIEQGEFSITFFIRQEIGDHHQGRRAGAGSSIASATASASVGSVQASVSATCRWITDFILAWANSGASNF